MSLFRALLKALARSHAIVMGDETGAGYFEVHNATFVRRATGEDLTIIGKNFGVARPFFSSDEDLFRALIPVLSWLPKLRRKAFSDLLTLDRKSVV